MALCVMRTAETERSDRKSGSLAVNGCVVVSVSWEESGKRGRSRVE